MPETLTKEARQRLLLTGADCILIAGSNAPTQLLLAALRFMRPGGCFAVFCENAEPLADALRRLRTLSLAANVRMCETWCREYQVLPKRTHPLMSMHGASGFLLTGNAVVHDYMVVAPDTAGPAASAASATSSAV